MRQGALRRVRAEATRISFACVLGAASALLAGCAANPVPEDPALLPLAAPAIDASTLVGEYRDADSFEVFHGLLLREDGTFAWAISAGAMDRTSAGTWDVSGGKAVLTTSPAPIAPVFEQAEPDISADAPYLSVTWPNGRGIPGIDFTLECADGERISDYTQYDGWNPAEELCADPKAISLSEGTQDIGPTRFDISAHDGGGLHFVLVPNDFGIMDLTGVTITPEPDGITLHLPGSRARMIRVDLEQDAGP